MIILHSENAHSVWMADEASKALENWAKKYILSHEHIRAVHAEERSAATKKPRSESEHADCISVLVEKLEDQGWFLPRIALKNNISYQITRHRLYQRTRVSPTMDRVVSQMFLSNLQMETQLVDNVSMPHKLHNLVTTCLGCHRSQLRQHYFHQRVHHSQQS